MPGNNGNEDGGVSLPRVTELELVGAMELLRDVVYDPYSKGYRDPRFVGAELILDRWYEQLSGRRTRPLASPSAEPSGTQAVTDEEWEGD